MTESAEPVGWGVPSILALLGVGEAIGKATDEPDFLLAALADRLATMEPIFNRPMLVAASRLEIVRGGHITAEEIVSFGEQVMRASLRSRTQRDGRPSHPGRDPSETP